MCIEDPTAEGCEPAPASPTRVPEPPDDDCLYDPSLPKCAPIDGECPEGFNMNEDGQCFPDKPCPTGFERRDEDETGRCYPIDGGSPSPTPPTTPPTTPINIVIVTEINTQIRNYYSTITIANKGMRILAVFDPCRLVDGGAILNLPSNNNLKLLAVDLEGSGSNTEVHKAVVMDLQRIQRITNNQVLYNVGFRGTVTGQSPITEHICFHVS